MTLINKIKKEYYLLQVKKSVLIITISILAFEQVCVPINL